MERRPAADGRLYTLQEFQNYYGAAYLAHWQRTDADAPENADAAPPGDDSTENPGQQPAGRGAGAAAPGEEPRADGAPPARDAAGADTPGEEPHARIHPV